MVLHQAFCGSSDGAAVADCSKPNRSLIFFGGFAPNETRALVKTLRGFMTSLEMIGRGLMSFLDAKRAALAGYYARRAQLAAWEEIRRRAAPRGD